MEPIGFKSYAERKCFYRLRLKHAQGGDLNAVLENDEDPHDPPLLLAAIADWFTTARWLLDQGVNLETTKNNGFTALHYAAVCGSYEMTSFLLDAGARIDARTCEGNTALHLVPSSFDPYSLCKLLLSRGACYDIRNAKGQDPENRIRWCGRVTAADLVADVRRAGGWAPYVAAPRAELLELRRTLPTLRHTPSVPLLQRLFKEVPEDVFTEVFAFWRSPRDL